MKEKKQPKKKRRKTKAIWRRSPRHISPENMVSFHTFLKRKIIQIDFSAVIPRFSSNIKFLNEFAFLKLSL